jgi:hypothetical protein
MPAPLAPLPAIGVESPEQLTQTGRGQVELMEIDCIKRTL